MSLATCDLYFAPLSLLQERHSRILSSAEDARRGRYTTRPGRDRFTLAAVLLRAVAAARAGCSPDRVVVTRSCEHCSRAHGRPRLPEIGLEVSVSYSGDFVAVAVTAAGSVGVDIEQITSVDFVPLLDTVCTPPEAALIRRPTDFFRCWTRKESILKATGAGLMLGMHRVVVTPPEAPPALVSYDGSPVDAQMAEITPDARYAAAAAVLSAAGVAFTTRAASGLIGAL